MKRSASFAHRARGVVRELGAGGAEVSAQAVADRMDLIFDREKRILYGTLQDMASRGELSRLRPGVYRLEAATDKPFEKREIMWRVLRARRTATAHYLAMQSGSTLAYAREWLGALARQDIVRRISKDGVEGEYQLISDQVEVPGDEAKAARLRGLRESKNAANDAIDRALKAHMEAYRALVDARMIINAMED
jgi:hypothetical protein